MIDFSQQLSTYKKFAEGASSAVAGIKSTVADPSILVNQGRELANQFNNAIPNLGAIGDKISSNLGTAAGKIVDEAKKTVTGAIDSFTGPAKEALGVSQLMDGIGDPSLGKIDPDGGQNPEEMATNPANLTPPDQQWRGEAIEDFRLRLVPVANKFDETFGGQSMSYFKPTGGILFPYRPTITWAGSAEYNPVSLVHSNQDYYMYSRTPSVTLQIQAPFTAQNIAEAEYSYAVMHFCRSLTKMNFGKKDQNRGLPPRMMILKGYGSAMFNELPVIFKDYNITFDNTVDYVGVKVRPGLTVSVPVYWTWSLTLVVQNTPKRWREEFKLDEFKNGSLIGSKGWF